MPHARVTSPGCAGLCDEHGALLVFVTGDDRLPRAWGGAQTLLGVRPDLTTLGRVIGGGLNIGAYGGPRALMERIAPAGPVYQAGTLSGSPLAVAAGLATLAELADGAVYASLERSSARLADGIAAAAAKAGVPCRVHRVGSMLGFFLSSGEVTSLADVDASDRAAFARVFHALLDSGVHLPPSATRRCSFGGAREPEIAAPRASSAPSPPLGVGALGTIAHPGRFYTRRHPTTDPHAMHHRRP